MRLLFYDKVDFRKATFNETPNFNFANFQKKANFLEIKIKSPLIFESITLSDVSYIVFKNIHYDDKTTEDKFKKIKIINTSINGHIDFYNVNFKKLNFQGSKVVGNGVINRINFEPECENWETATLLKHEEIKRDNIIKALEYKAIEKNLYQTELAQKKYKSIQTWAEWASIWLSKKSNNHGQNWVQAVRFTLLSGLFFFLIYSLLRYFDFDMAIIFIENLLLKPVETIFGALQIAFEDFFAMLATFYIPVDFSEIKSYIDDDEKLGLRDFFAILFYFAGKIFISYGYVEIVQAFRKLK